MAFSSRLNLSSSSTSGNCIALASGAVPDSLESLKYWSSKEACVPKKHDLALNLSAGRYHGIDMVAHPKRLGYSFCPYADGDLCTEKVYY